MPFLITTTLKHLKLRGFVSCLTSFLIASIHVHSLRDAGDENQICYPTEHQETLVLRYTCALQLFVLQSNSLLQWLNDVFLKYLEDWSKEVAQRENFTAAQKQKMMLSQVTLKGLFITGTGGILDVN